MSVIAPLGRPGGDEESELVMNETERKRLPVRAGWVVLVLVVVLGIWDLYPVLVVNSHRQRLLSVAGKGMPGHFAETYAADQGFKVIANNPVPDTRVVVIVPMKRQSRLWIWSFLLLHKMDPDWCRPLARFAPFVTFIETSGTITEFH